MKSNTLLMLLLAVGISASAQTTEKKAKINNVALAVYNADNKTHAKEGLFAIKNLENDGLWVQGTYKNDQRTGNWNFFNKDFQLTMRYNYDQKKLLFVDSKSLKNVAVTVISNDDKVKNGASAPLPMCSVDYYLQTVANSAYAFSDSQNAGRDAEITAYVSANGDATYTLNYLKDGKKSTFQNISLPADKFEIEWMPSMYNGKPVDSQFTVYVNIAPDESQPDQTKRIRWDN